MDEKLMDLTKNEDLMNGLVECQTADELMALLRANSIELDADISPEKAFEMVKKQAHDELSPEELDAVSGGSISLAVGLTAAGAFILAAGALCFLAGYAYETFNRSKKRR